MNILIIETSKTSRLVLETIFQPYATNLFFASSGVRAKKIYDVVSIELICVPFYLSDMSATDFIADIRKLELGKTIPILMITSQKSQAATAKSLTDGATEIFRKDNLVELERYLQLYAEQARQQVQIEGDILLLDNDLKQVAEIRSFFKNTKLKFIHLTNAEAAEELVQAAEFDLVITNVVLGGAMSGLELIREIREINETMYRVPILAISAIVSASQKIELLRAGVNDFIEKPILLEELGVRMKNLLHNKKLFDTVELQKKQLEEMASRDHLTGLYNRHYCLDAANRIFQDASRYNYPISLLVIDLDFFKKVNDTYGHSVGDLVLKGVAGVLLKTFRVTDTPVRFGGEEFLVILPHCAGKDAMDRAEFVRRKISALHPADIAVTASIGVSERAGTSQASYEELFATADEALYAAKSAGRNRVVFREVVNRPAPEE